MQQSAPGRLRSERLAKPRVWRSRQDSGPHDERHLGPVKGQRPRQRDGRCARFSVRFGRHSLLCRPSNTTGSTSRPGPTVTPGRPSRLQGMPPRRMSLPTSGLENPPSLRRRNGSSSTTRARCSASSSRPRRAPFPSTSGGASGRYRAIDRAGVWRTICCFPGARRGRWNDRYHRRSGSRVRSDRNARSRAPASHGGTTRSRL